MLGTGWAPPGVPDTLDSDCVADHPVADDVVEAGDKLPPRRSRHGPAAIGKVFEAVSSVEQGLRNSWSSIGVFFGNASMDALDLRQGGIRPKDSQD